MESPNRIKFFRMITVLDITIWSSRGVLNETVRHPKWSIFLCSRKSSFPKWSRKTSRQNWRRFCRSLHASSPPHQRSLSTLVPSSWSCIPIALNFPRRSAASSFHMFPRRGGGRGRDGADSGQVDPCTSILNPNLPSVNFSNTWSHLSRRFPNTTS